MEQYPAQVEQLVAGGDYTGAHAFLDKIGEFCSQEPQVVRLSPTCAGQEKGASCWIELANQPGCYFWNRSWQPDEIVTWTGECAGGVAQGTSTLRSGWDDGKKTDEHTGSLVEGKHHGRWVVRAVYGRTRSSTFKNGKVVD